MGQGLPLCRGGRNNVKLTLSQRLSLAFSVLLLASCGVSAWLQIRANDMREMEVVQGLSRGLAHSIAVNAQLTGSDDLGPDSVRHLFDQLMTVNPSVEVYLLDKTGNIIGNAAPPGHLKRQHIDLAPVHKFLAGGMLPIAGDDPRSVSRRKVFSAAALHREARDGLDGRDGHEVGYIYVILQGEAHDRYAASAGINAVLRVTLWSMALVALLTLVAAWAALRWITRPLHKLTDTMRRFDTQAEQALVPPPTVQAADQRDEIAVLEISFRQMAARISEQWQTLKQMDHDRREVVANISHDLRTPLTSIHGYLETLAARDATLDAADRQRYLAIALGQSRKVGRLAQALFDLARLEHGGVEPLPENFLLNDLIQDVFQKFELQAQAGQVRLDAELSGNAMVTADLGMIERVLSNLIDNAIRHTPVGGTVTVAVEKRTTTVELCIRDTGPGIPAELLDNLFKRPFALSGEGRRGGIGLLIVHRILQLHHRSIALRSEPGKGACFCFELPLVVNTN
ncbi:HAMP domain-containing histidine kinase [Undibacterium sp. CY18W]|uniref:histidine kinase n=1 Tax=Undibacterium hunanense TaxID=2762292 RepID=A0ABR6ZXF2_9BURK|nr:HAMP domain-containing sensor histidine kinase [Undibacterium hunanense]MBC3920538.1 HAMP domain-containing histidine kinase [Undibacterium hunanense]